MNLSTQVASAASSQSSMASTGTGPGSSAVESGMFASVMAAQTSSPASNTVPTANRSDSSGTSLINGSQNSTALDTQSKADGSALTHVMPENGGSTRGLQTSIDTSSLDKSLNAGSFTKAVPGQNASMVPVLPSSTGSNSATGLGDNTGPTEGEAAQACASKSLLQNTGKTSLNLRNAASTGRIFPADRQADVTLPGDADNGFVDNYSSLELSELQGQNPNKSGLDARDMPVLQGKNPATLQVGKDPKDSGANGLSGVDSRQDFEVLKAGADPVPSKAASSQTSLSELGDADDASVDADASGESSFPKKARNQQATASPDLQGSPLNGLPAAVPGSMNPARDNSVAPVLDKTTSAPSVVPGSEATTQSSTLAGHGMKKSVAVAVQSSSSSNNKNFATERKVNNEASGESADAVVANPASVRPPQSGQKVKSTSQSPISTNAASVSLPSATESVVSMSADKTSVGKLKSRSRDTNSSVSAGEDTDGSKGNNSDGLTIVQAPMAVDFPVVATHATAVPANGTFASGRESDMASAGLNKATSGNIGIASGVSFTPAQNVHVDMGMNGGRQQVEVGFHDGTLGWLSVRATTANDGGLHLSMSGRSNETAAAVDRMMPSLQHFLQDHDVRAHSVSYARQESGVTPVATMAMSTSAFSADSSGGSQSDRSGTGMNQQRSSNPGSDAREFSQKERNTQERAGPARSSSRYEGLLQEQGLLSIRI